MGKLHPTETSVYDFEPGLSGDRTGRYITLEEGGTGSTIIVSSQDADTAQPIPTASNKDYHWASLVKKILTPTYLSTLIATLRDHSSLPELVTTQLLQHLLKVYHHKVEVIISSEGMDSLDTGLPHFKLVSQRKSGTKKLELVFDDDKIKTYLKNSLSELFTYTGFWEEFARAIGANLIVWAAENLEQHIGHATLTALQPEELTQDVSRSLLEMDTTLLQERISFFGQIYCQDITRKIVKGFDLPNCSLQDMDKLLGLKPKPPTEVRTRLDLDPIAVLPTSIPIASSIRAQLRPDLWQQNTDELAVFQHRSKNNPNNYIEHYITNPGDIALLPWEAADQIINKFGFDTVKLQLIFAARTMEEDEPWSRAFTLKASDIIHLLGWDRNHNTSLSEKRNAVASTAFALSCLLVKSVWIEGRGRKQIDASTPIGRMWDVLIDPHGQMDWVTGKIEKPEEVYITVSPGLWTKHFLNRAGSKAKEALHQFGYLAKDILKIDPYHNEMALRLAIQLTLDARIRARNENPYAYRVLNLLEEVLPKAEIEKALEDKYKARDLRNRWDNALKLLSSLGWQIEFDPVTYAGWLQPDSCGEKPEDWRKVKVIDRLFRANLTIKPPHPVPGLLAKIKEPKKPKQIAAAPVDKLTGDQVKQGREKLSWNRKELGGFLDLSADYIGKLERGDREITPELETRLRKLLHL